jgi:hypothetical protein
MSPSSEKPTARGHSAGWSEKTGVPATTAAPTIPSRTPSRITDQLNVRFKNGIIEVKGLRSMRPLDTTEYVSQLAISLNEQRSVTSDQAASLQVASLAHDRANQVGP